MNRTFLRIEIESRLPYAGDELRLNIASILVLCGPLLLLALLWTHYYHPAWQELLLRPASQKRALTTDSRIYPVLIEQALQATPADNQIRALAEYNSAGHGGITTRYGFHTLSNTDIFSMTGQAAQTPSPTTAASSYHPNDQASTESTSETGLEEQPTSNDNTQNKGTNRPQPKSLAGNGMHFKIPANYRFEQHMALRYDNGALTAIATASMPGADYFRNMIRQIRLTFAPPGQNYLFRDRFGYTMNQAIQPQVVQIQFAISPDGQITDVRKVASRGQTKVDQACIEVLRNKNFGQPPPEIFRNGNVFGINFVFPDMRRYK
ncbi:MAG: TonB C-terminal domain-containing protein [Leptospiraceae bacterium]|nr:TonB C-terminal domain-containing protein [Leptospiraceae bacterium]